MGEIYGIVVGFLGPWLIRVPSPTWIVVVKVIIVVARSMEVLNGIQVLPKFKIWDIIWTGLCGMSRTWTCGTKSKWRVEMRSRCHEGIDLLTQSINFGHYLRWCAHLIHPCAHGFLWIPIKSRWWPPLLEFSLKGVQKSHAPISLVCIKLPNIIIIF